MSNDNSRIPVSQLPVFSPIDSSYYIVCNRQDSDTGLNETGVISSTELVSNYLSAVLTGDDNYPGLNDYLSTHSGGGGASLIEEVGKLALVDYTFPYLSDANIIIYYHTDSSVLARTNVKSFLDSYTSEYMSTNMSDYLDSLSSESPFDGCKLLVFGDDMTPSYITLSDLADYLSNRST